MSWSFHRNLDLKGQKWREMHFIALISANLPEFEKKATGSQQTGVVESIQTQIQGLGYV